MQSSRFFAIVFKVIFKVNAFTTPFTHVLLATLLTAFAGVSLAQTPTAETKTPGGYEVPTEEEELKEFANFQVEDIRIRQDEGRTRLSYRLPKALLGVSQKVQFEGREGLTGTLTGNHGEMTCTPLAEGKVSCSVGYKNLRVDETARENLLRQISQSPTELDKRLRLARGFERDPHGILTFLTPESESNSEIEFNESSSLPASAY